MKRVLAGLGSHRTATVLLVALAGALVVQRAFPGGTAIVAAGFGWALAASLLAALLAQPRARRGANGVFHLGLLALIVLVLVGQRLRFEGRVEVTTGAEFDSSAIMTTRRGPGHELRLRDGDFRQGDFDVNYAPQLRRGRTESHVVLRDGSTRAVGDDRPLLLQGYRLYTTHNKGYAPLLAWTAADGTTLTGSIHMPSYPLFDWRQSNEWRAPDGAQLRLWLQVRLRRDDARSWVLRSDSCNACRLVVELRGQRHELVPGDSLALPGGARLQLLAIRGWMGYRIFYDPTLPWLLGLALLCCAALGVHLAASLPRRSAFVPRGATLSQSRAWPAAEAAP